MVPASYGSDSFGRADNSEFVPDETIRANVDERLTGQEAIRAARDEPFQRVVLTIRAKSNVTTNSRFEWRGKTLRVINVGSPGVMRRYQRIECAYAGD